MFEGSLRKFERVWFSGCAESDAESRGSRVAVGSFDEALSRGYGGRGWGEIVLRDQEVGCVSKLFHMLKVRAPTGCFEIIQLRCSVLRRTREIDDVENADVTEELRKWTLVRLMTKPHCFPHSILSPGSHSEHGFIRDISHFMQFVYSQIAFDGQGQTAESRSASRYFYAKSRECVKNGITELFDELEAVQVTGMSPGVSGDELESIYSISECLLASTTSCCYFDDA